MATEAVAQGQDWVGIALVLTAIGTITTPVVIAYFGRKNVAATEKVHAEVATGNALNIGAVADKIYSGQIEAKPEEERTSGEVEHQATMAANDPTGVVAADQAAAAERKKE